MDSDVAIAVNTVPIGATCLRVLKECLGGNEAKPLLSGLGCEVLVRRLVQEFGDGVGRVESASDRLAVRVSLFNAALDLSQLLHLIGGELPVDGGVCLAHIHGVFHEHELLVLRPLGVSFEIELGEVSVVFRLVESICVFQYFFDHKIVLVVENTGVICLVNLISPVSHRLCLLELVVSYRRVSGDRVLEEWIAIAEVVAGFAFSECQACRQAIDDPRACLDDATLSNWEFLVELIN